MVSTETQFDIARIPIDTAKGAAKLAVWPLHFGKTVVTNAVDTAFKVAGTNTEDEPHAEALPEGESVYDNAKYNMDIAGMIYYYTELRAETKKLVGQFCAKKGIDMEKDLPVLKGAIRMVKDQMAGIEAKSSPEHSPTNKNKVESVKKFNDALAQLDGLCKRFGINKGERRVFQSYFEILEEPKDMAMVYADLVRYDQYIDPQFRLAFGGTEFNRNNVEDMISHDDKIIIHKIDDDFNTSTLDIDGFVGGVFSEMVWAIVINKTDKKITVVFRGSTNLRDWGTNIIQCNMEDCVLPGYTSDKIIDKGKYCGRVHKGFYHYLFGKTKKGVDGRCISKGEEIVGELVGLLGKPQYAGFNIEVTGHLLGGSLSTLFAFRCARLGDFGDATITNVSFASPFVGDDEFRKEFIELERKRKILHLRISNHQDVVPLIPAVNFPSLHGVTRFKHVGMNIRLYDRGNFLAPGYRRFYPKDDDMVNWVRNAFHNNILMGLSVGYNGKHLLPEYLKRLEDPETKKQLQQLSFQKLYQDKEITGWDFYETKK